MEIGQIKPACMAPFRQLVLGSDGAIYPCCYHFGYKLGSIESSTLQEVWTGKKIQRLRDELINGQISICKSRMHNMKCHKRFEHLRTNQAIDSELIRLDVRLNGKCNLKCVMCEVWKEPNGKYTEENFWSEARKTLFPWLKEIEILGGEPFIQDDTWKLIEEITRVNPRCRFSFVTNGHYKITTRIRDTLAGISIDKIQLSLDSINPQTYHEIRGGNHTLTMNAFHELLALRSAHQSKFDLMLSMCVTQLNWTQVSEFVEFAKSHQCSIDLQFAYYDSGSHTSLRHLPESRRVEVANTWRAEFGNSQKDLILPLISGLGLPEKDI